MATTTPNFGWTVPTSSDLVKNGATAIETLGDGIDASLVDLKGGSTDQVLAKNSNTDLDFKWVTSGGGGSGGWTSLATGSLSGNNVTVNFTSTGYKQIVIYVKDPSCTTDWYWNMRIGGNTGNNYNYVNTYSSSSSAATTVSYSSASGFGNDGPADLADYNAMGVWTIYDPDQTTTRKIVTGSFGYRDNTNSFNASGWLVGQYFNTPAVVSSIDLYPSSTWSSGTYEVYGVK